MLQIFFFIISIGFLLLVIFSIPLFLQVWRTAKSMATTLEELNKRLPGILKNIEDITANVSGTTDIILKEAERITLLSDKIHGIVNVADRLERMAIESLRMPLLKTIKTVSGVLKGVSAFVHTFRAAGGKTDGGPGCRG